MSTLVELLGPIQELQALCRQCIEQPGSDSVRAELIGRIELGAWPFAGGEVTPEGFLTGVSAARLAAEMVRGAHLTSPPVFGRLVEQLAAALTDLELHARRALAA
jgi:hypothetical protein